MTAVKSFFVNAKFLGLQKQFWELPVVTAPADGTTQFTMYNFPLVFYSI